MVSQKRILQDVVIIRLLLIVLLVLYHAFAIYNGAWEMPVGIHQVASYWWIASFSYSFMLETFVFISGYVFGYQIRTKFNNQVSFSICIVNKAKRLLVPSLFFSVIYFICFHHNSGNIFEGIYDIVIGSGHMWFLPTLFLCFVAIYIMHKLNISAFYTILIAFFCALFSVGPLDDIPFRISLAMYYFLFFALGYFIQKNHISTNSISKPRTIIIVFFLYLFVFWFYQDKYYIHHPNNIDTPFFIQVTSSLFRRFLKITQALLGLITVLGLVNYIINFKKVRISSLAFTLSGYCFGVYIFQQFILKFLVHNQYIINLLGSIWFPWVAFLVTLLVSLGLSYIFLKTKIGRSLIG